MIRSGDQIPIEKTFPKYSKAAVVDHLSRKTVSVQTDGYTLVFADLYVFLDRLMETEVTVDSAATLKQCIVEVTGDYEEKIAGAKKRLTNALEIIIIAYYASIIKEKSDEMIDSLMNR